MAAQTIGVSQWPTCRRIRHMPAPQSRSHRIFLALWPDPDTQGAIVDHANLWTWPAECARYKPVDWHVTLHFLGSVPSHDLPKLTAELQVPFEPCGLVLDSPQQWSGGLAVLAASEVPPELVSLHQRLAESIAGLNLPVESRVWRAHVTLARRADTSVPPTRCAPVVWPVRSYALVLSTGRPQERYQLIDTYRF